MKIVSRVTTMLLVVSCLLSATANAKRAKLSPRTALKDAKTAIDKVIDSSDGAIRLAVFDAQVALSRKKAKVIRRGLESELMPVRRRAITLGLRSKVKSVKRTAVTKIGALLCSNAPEQVSSGQALRLRVKSKAMVQLLHSIVVDCPNSGLAEEAKRAMIKRGGKIGWALIEKDLNDDKDLSKRKKAFQLALAAKSKTAARWAYGKIHEETELGELARTLMIGLAGTRLGRSYVPDLKRGYRKAKAQDDFAQRLRLAMIIGNLGGVKSVQDTLFAAFSPDYRAPAGITNTRARAWKGLLNVRKMGVLNRDISRRHKLKVRDLFCSVQTEEEAQSAFEWLYNWTKRKQSKKLYKILEKCFQSDYKFARTYAIMTLAKLGNRRNIAVFEAALKDPNPLIRRAGARGIAAVASKGDEERLGKLLQRERDEEGKLALIAGLRRIGTPASIAPLKFMVFRQPKAVTIAVIDALAETKDPSLAKNIASLKSSSDDEIRIRVWKHLLTLDAETYLPAFVSSVTSWLKPGHVQDFSKVKQIPLDVFAELAGKGKPEISGQALKVLSRAGDQGASFILDAIENHDDEQVAVQALEALARLRKKKSVSYYAKALEHRYGPVRAVAARLVARYGSKRRYLGKVMAKRADKYVPASIAAHVASYTLSKKRR